MIEHCSSMVEIHPAQTVRAKKVSISVLIIKTMSHSPQNKLLPVQRGAENLLIRTAIVLNRRRKSTSCRLNWTQTSHWHKRNAKNWGIRSVHSVLAKPKKRSVRSMSWRLSRWRSRWERSSTSLCLNCSNLATKSAEMPFWTDCKNWLLMPQLSVSCLSSSRVIQRPLVPE